MSAVVRVTLRCDGCGKGPRCRCCTPPETTLVGEGVDKHAEQLRVRVEFARKHAAEHLGWVTTLRRRRQVDLCPACQKDGERP